MCHRRARMAGLSSQTTAEFEAIQIRQIDIEEHDAVRGLLLHVPRERLTTRSSFVYVQLRRTDGVGSRLATNVIAVYVQNPHLSPTVVSRETY
jgi:hypothetical protein